MKHHCVCAILQLFFVERQCKVCEACFSLFVVLSNMLNSFLRTLTIYLYACAKKKLKFTEIYANFNGIA